MNNNLLFLILILLFYIFFNFNIELFQVVGYNNTLLPDYKIESIYETETKTLQELFKNISDDSDFNTTDYILHNIFIEFPLKVEFKRAILDFLNEKNIFKKDKIEITGDLKNIYYKDKIYIFNCTLLNSTKFLIRNLKIKLKVNNNNIITILSITLDSDNFDIFTLIGKDDLNPNMYEIKNKLYLLDPFLTSGKDQIVTQEMKNNFVKITKDKEIELQNII